MLNLEFEFGGEIALRGGRNLVTRNSSLQGECLFLTMSMDISIFVQKNVREETGTFWGGSFPP